MSSKARNRPPRLEPAVGRRNDAPPPSLAQRLERTHVAGRAAAPGPSELRRIVERAAGERAPSVLLDDAWAAVEKVFGATLAAPRIDPARTIAAMHDAFARLVDVARSGARVAFATSRPASLLTLHLELARVARAAGAHVLADDDSPPLRVDGRAARGIRWFDGVAVVTDGQSLCATRGPDAPQEWLFILPRPALVIADGPFADAALDDGIEVIAFAGLEHARLALARPPEHACLVVPMWTDREPNAYRPLVDAARRGDDIGVVVERRDGASGAR